MKKVLFMLVVTMFSFSLYADEVQCLAIEYADEATDYFALDANPVITYGDGTTINVTQDGEDAYSIEDISLDNVTKYYFTEAEPTTGEEGGEHDGIGGINAGGALVTGLEEGAHVYVYTADGQVVMSAVAGKNGQVGVDLNNLKGGQVYILRTPKASYKIVK